MTPLIAVLPYHFRHEKALADLTLDQLDFPLQQDVPSGMRKVSDLGSEDHLIVYCCSTAFQRSHRKIRCHVSLLITEPRAVQMRYYLLSLLFWKKFFRVLTFSDWLLKLLPNAVLYLSAGKTVEPWQGDRKSALISIIASKKRNLPGHRMRHEFIRRSAQEQLPLDLFGRVAKEIARKEEGLADYMYSVVIENSRENNYFTEKLLDCLLQKAIPLYWGAPNIGDFFNLDGMIVCHTMEELIDARRKIDAEMYEHRRVAVDENFEIAMAILPLSLSAALTISAEAGASLTRPYGRIF